MPDRIMFFILLFWNSAQAVPSKYDIVDAYNATPTKTLLEKAFACRDHSTALLEERIVAYEHTFLDAQERFRTYRNDGTVASQVEQKRLRDEYLQAEYNYVRAGNVLSDYYYVWGAAMRAETASVVDRAVSQGEMAQLSIRKLNEEVFIDYWLKHDETCIDQLERNNFP